MVALRSLNLKIPQPKTETDTIEGLRYCGPELLLLRPSGHWTWGLEAKLALGPGLGLLQVEEPRNGFGVPGFRAGDRGDFEKTFLPMAQPVLRLASAPGSYFCVKGMVYAAPEQIEVSTELVYI